ncbi:flagellar hook-associated protein 3 [Pandoraea cepalis]|uniref:Flagellar hook-associated protein 3 n=1 Tax=Pandoraea cepalis TaxID=2508294 RepID=A0A5E4ULQ0_9BURK|nr:hypothetical protein [Pandoraea cepalis]VVE00443.1 flagellar hook-associated protein 3 [Pandoraea cepalis]
MQIHHHLSRFEREHVLRDMNERLERLTDHAREEKRVLHASDDPVDFERIARIDRAQQTLAQRTKVITSLEADLKQASVSLRSAHDRLSAFKSDVVTKAGVPHGGDAQDDVGKIHALMRGLTDAFNIRRADGSHVFARIGAPITDTAAPGAATTNFALATNGHAPASVEIGDGLHHTHPPQMWHGLPDLLNRLGAAAATLANGGGANAAAVLRELAEPIDNQVTQIADVQFANDHSAKRLEAVRKEHGVHSEVLVKARLAIEGKPATEAFPELMALYRAMSAARTAHAEVGRLSFFDAL